MKVPRPWLAGVAAVAMLLPGLRASAAEAPLLVLDVVPGARDAAADARAPVTFRLTNRGSTSVRLAPLSLARAGEARPGTLRVFTRSLRFPAVPRTPFAVLGRDPASPRTTDLAPGASLELAVDLELPYRPHDPAVFAVQAAYVHTEAGDGAFTGVVTSPVLRFAVRPGAHARGEPATVRWPLLAPAASVPAALVVDAPAFARAPAGFRVRFAGTGTTHAVDVFASNPSDEPVILRVPTGTRFVPTDGRVQTLMAVASPDVLCPPRGRGRATIPAVCTDRTLRPPDDGLALAVPPGRPFDAPDPLRDVALASAAGHRELRRFLPTGTWTLPGLGFSATTEARVAVGSPEPGADRLVVLSTRVVPPVGPYERARGGSPPTLRLDGPSAPWSSPDAEPARPVPLVPGPRTADLRPSFGETVTLWAVWTAANDAGTPNVAELAARTEAQATAQGVPSDRAKAVGQQVAREVVPFLLDAAARAQPPADVPVDWGALDLSLKGAPPPPASGPGGDGAAELLPVAPFAATRLKRLARVLSSDDPTLLLRVLVDGAPLAPPPAGTPRAVFAPEAPVRVESSEARPAAPVPAEPPAPLPLAAPPPQPFELAVDWRRKADDEDLVRAQAMTMRFSGDELEIEGATLPGRYGGTFQRHDFSGIDFGEGRTLESVVRAALATPPPEPTVPELRKGCGRGALSISNTRIVSVLEHRERQRIEGRDVTESSRTASLLLDYSWIYDCETGRLELRLSIRFTVTEGGRHVSEYQVDRLLAARDLALR